MARKEISRRRAQANHPVVQKLLHEDERRAALKSPYSWEQPNYMTPAGEATLAAINAIASHWENCGFAVRASGRRDIRLAVSAPSYTRSFEVSPLPATVSAVKPGRPSQRVRLALWLDCDRQDPRVKSKPSLEFDRVDAGVMEALTALLITKCEESFRARMVWRRERIVADRIQALRAAEAADRRAREEREAAILALRNKRDLLLREAIDGSRLAKEIRDLEAGLRAGPAAGEVCKEPFERWSAWALQRARALDPLQQNQDSLATWLSKFELDS
jgi:hypothetical protein